MNAPDTLRMAAYALNNRTNIKTAPVLAGLLKNRADDAERDIVNWQRAGQDVPALVKDTTSLPHCRRNWLPLQEDH